jgi:predicted ATPase
MDVIDALTESAAGGDGGLLEQLSPEQVQEMAAACLADRDGSVPATVTEVLDARAEGLPFLVEELLAGLVSRGSLVASDSGWRLSGDLEVTDVPLSFAQTVSERLATLLECDRRVVECAAIHGRDFDWSHVPRVAHAPEPEVLAVSLSPCADR